MFTTVQKIAKNNKNLTFLALAVFIAVLFRNNTLSEWLLVVATIIGLIAPVQNILNTIRVGHLPLLITLPLVSIAALVAQDFWTAIAVTISASVLQKIEQLILADIANLDATMPTHATVIKGKTTTRMSIKQINPGMVIDIAPGEIIPLDGEIISGNTRVQDTLLTGEMTLVTKDLGSRVYAGSVNQDQKILIKVIHTARHGQYNLAGSMYRNARATTSDLLRSSSVITILIMVIGIISSAATYYTTKEAPLALIILIMANPFLIVLCAKLALYGGLSRAVRKGIYFKSLRAMENSAAIKEIYLDLNAVLPANSYQVTSFTAKHEQKTRVMSIAHTMAANSKNAPMQAIGGYAASAAAIKDVTVIKHRTDGLVTARWKNGALMMGYGYLLREKGIHAATEPEKIYLALNDKIIGIFTLKLSVTPDEQTTAQQLMQITSNNINVFSDEPERISRQPVAALQLVNLYPECTDADKIQVIQNSTKTPTLYLSKNPQDPALTAATISAGIYPTGLSADIPKTDIVILGSRTNVLPDAILIAKQSVKRLLLFTGTAVLITFMSTLSSTILLSDPIDAAGIYLLETGIFLFLFRTLAYRR